MIYNQVILVNVDIVYIPEACDDSWRAVPALLTVSEHTEYMVSPPPHKYYFGSAISTRMTSEDVKIPENSKTLEKFQCC